MFTILIIEDDASICRNMQLILEMEGFHVLHATDGNSGIAVLRDIHPDLILCDIMMADMDGYSVLETLKNNELMAEIPFIFVTAMGDRADIRKGMSAGADDYLTKPFTSEELIAAVTGRLRRVGIFRHQGLKASFQKEYDILMNVTSLREREVLSLVGSGANSMEIAQRLGISIKTVNIHRKHLMDKLGADNAAMLARWSIVAESMRESSHTHLP